LRILLINPPHPSTGSRIPRAAAAARPVVGGRPLIDAGHLVELLHGEFGPMLLETSRPPPS
jgi:hypothetical protein